MDVRPAPSLPAPMISLRFKTPLSSSAATYPAISPVPVPSRHPPPQITSQPPPPLSPQIASSDSPMSASPAPIFHFFAVLSPAPRNQLPSLSAPTSIQSLAFYPQHRGLSPSSAVFAITGREIEWFTQSGTLPF
jgi:hypothetical protein